MLYGGHAGSGKSAWLLFEGARYAEDDGYTGVIFRRTSPEITTPGGLWDTAHSIYRKIFPQARPQTQSTSFVWPKGGRLRFSHLQYEQDKYSHHGGQYAFEGFDELTTFTKTQFLYLLTRNRPSLDCRVIPYWRATCNPDADSWVRDLIDWWIGDDGYIIKERCGVVRWYTVLDNDIVWVDEDWRSVTGERPKSFTFIEGLLSDNQILLQQDPGYMNTLYAQDHVTRERLLSGNWNVSYKGGLFLTDKFILEDSLPEGGVDLWCYWDLSGTEKKEGSQKGNKEPAYTCRALAGFDRNGDFWIVDVYRFRKSPGESVKEMQRIADLDGAEVPIGVEEEKGASGKFTSDYLKETVLPGYEVHPDPVSGDKIERAKPWAAFAEQGRVHVLRGPWNRPFLSECGAFPIGTFKDQVDSVSGCWKMAKRTNRVLYLYNPAIRNENLNIFSHRARMKVSADEFLKADANMVQVYICLSRAPDGVLYASFYSWARKSRTLRVYGEIVEREPEPLKFATAIAEKCLVSLEPKSNMVSVRAVYGNADFFSKPGDLQHVFRQVGLRVKEQRHYDEAGGVLWSNKLFARDQIRVGDHLVDTDRDLRTWTVTEAGAIRKYNPGYWLARNLTMVVWELRGLKELDAPAPMRPYGRAKKELRAKLRQGEYRSVVAKKSEWDYLTK
jgi:predicted phage terminase large subunit-like protein